MNDEMVRAVESALREYLIRIHGIFTTDVCPQDFIEWLRERGYEITPTPAAVAEDTDFGSLEEM